MTLHGSIASCCIGWKRSTPLRIAYSRGLRGLRGLTSHNPCNPWLILKVPGLNESHFVQVDAALQRFADLLIRQRLDLFCKIGVPLHRAVVVELAGDAADEFTIL